MKERRKFVRKQFRIPCHFTWEGRTISGVVLNLSYGGLRISGAATVPPDGADIAVTLELSSHYQCTLVAFVVRSETKSPDGGAFGVEFYGSLEERSEKLTPIFGEAFPGNTSVH